MEFAPFVDLLGGEAIDTKISRIVYDTKLYCGKGSSLLFPNVSLDSYDLELSVKSVNGVKEAIKHINKYGSSHTDSIVTKNKKTAKKFLSNINSAIALHNA